jgi:hypothetical protein
MSGFVSTSRASTVSFVQCRLGAPAQKYPTLIYSPGLGGTLDQLSELVCIHNAVHAKPIRGLGEDGTYNSVGSERWPARLSVIIALSIA